jgi:hypothetical protein
MCFLGHSAIITMVFKFRVDSFAKVEGRERMESAERTEHRLRPQRAAHVVSKPDRPDNPNGRIVPRVVLADDIDNLREKMAETFLKEASFTADPVILISRELDLKINEYMKQFSSARRKVR